MYNPANPPQHMCDVFLCHQSMGEHCNITACHTALVYGANHFFLSQSTEGELLDCVKLCTCPYCGVADGAGSQEASRPGLLPLQASLHAQSRGSGGSSSFSTECVGCRGSHSGTARGRGVRNGCGSDFMCLLRDMWACGHLYSLKSELLHKCTCTYLYRQSFKKMCG